MVEARWPSSCRAIFFWADDFGLGAFEFLGGQALVAEQFRFLEQFRFDEFNLGRFGAGVKPQTLKTLEIIFKTIDWRVFWVIKVQLLATKFITYY